MSARSVGACVFVVMPRTRSVGRSLGMSTCGAARYVECTHVLRKAERMLLALTLAVVTLVIGMWIGRPLRHSL